MIYFIIARMPIVKGAVQLVAERDLVAFVARSSSRVGEEWCANETHLTN
jgi:hypothetical protein